MRSSFITDVEQLTQAQEEIRESLGMDTEENPEQNYLNFSEDQIPEFAKGGKIYIKPSKRGTFTTAAKKRGMSVKSFAAKVMANKGQYSSAMVKKANFSRNAAKWNKQYGGSIMPNIPPDTLGYSQAQVGAQRLGSMAGDLYSYPYYYGEDYREQNPVREELSFGDPTSPSYDPYLPAETQDRYLDAQKSVEYTPSLGYTPISQGITTPQGAAVSAVSDSKYIDIQREDTFPRPGISASGAGRVYDSVRSIKPLSYSQTELGAPSLRTDIDVGSAYDPAERTTTLEERQGWSKAADYARVGAAALPGAYNIIRGLTEEPDELDEYKYRVGKRVEAYKPDITPVIRDIKTMGRQTTRGARGSYAAQVAINAQMAEALDKAYTQQANIYGQNRMWAETTNIGTEMYNARIAAQIDKFNVAQRAAPGNLIGAGLGQLSQVAQAYSQEQLQREYMRNTQMSMEQFLEYQEYQDKMKIQGMQGASSETQQTTPDPFAGMTPYERWAAQNRLNNMYGMSQMVP